MSENNFEVALRGYEELLSQIMLQENDIEKMHFDIKQLTISCRLGAVCCYLKLELWHEALNLNKSTLNFHERDLSPVEKTRSFYFESFALYNLAMNEERLSNKRIGYLRKSEAACEKLISSVKVDSHDSHSNIISEYFELHDNIKLKVIIFFFCLAPFFNVVNYHSPIFVAERNDTSDSFREKSWCRTGVWRREK